jgi:hypothetical protein
MENPMRLIACLLAAALCATPVAAQEATYTDQALQHTAGILLNLKNRLTTAEDLLLRLCAYNAESLLNDERLAYRFMRETLDFEHAMGHAVLDIDEAFTAINRVATDNPNYDTVYTPLETLVARFEELAAYAINCGEPFEDPPPDLGIEL